MAYLADVNFLVALLFAHHPSSASAVAWLNRQHAPASIKICRVAQMGVLRVLTNPRWLREETLAPVDVWKAYELLLTDDRFAETTEPPNLLESWRSLTLAQPKGFNVETDCYLAAFALAAGLRVLTFDQGFRRFPAVALELLS